MLTLSIFVQLVKIIGSIVVLLISKNYIVSFREKGKIRLDNIEKLEEIIRSETKKKWYIEELFYQITKLRIDYDNICSLIQGEYILQKLYLLQKYKRMYQYRNNKFQYNNEFINEKSFCFCFYGNACDRFIFM